MHSDAGMGGMPFGSSMPNMPPRPEPERVDVIPPRTYVRIRGLVSATEHNGMGGKVEGFDGANLDHLIHSFWSFLC